jgi:SPP1 family predicted phage head-tail adaptor
MSRPVPAGQRDQQVTILRDANDGMLCDAAGQPIENWVAHCQWWCRALPTRGRDFAAADAGQVQASILFAGNYRADVTHEMRVLWRGVVFEIVGDPIDVGGGRHTLELACKAVRQRQA